MCKEVNVIALVLKKIKGFIERLASKKTGGNNLPLQPESWRALGSIDMNKAD